MTDILASICSNLMLAQVLYIVKKVLDIIQIAGPILAIVMLSIHFAKGMVNPADEDNIKKNIFNTIKAIVLLFFMPMFFDMAMILLSDNGLAEYIDLPTCWVEAENIHKLQKGYKPDFSDDSTSKNSSKKKNTSASQNAIKKIKSKSKSKSKKAVKNGKKYKLKKSQVKYLAAICMREQGTVSGMRGEANLIANRYELYGKKKYSSVYDYVKNSGWFGSRSVSPSNNKKAINVANTVFVQGNRSVPLYVDEHDCWFCNSKACRNGNSGDICSISGHTKKSYITKRSNYKQNKTKINNVYGSKYTFYYFPSSTSDPFGYTKIAYNKVKAMNK